jgi:Domain of unknown function (DUF1918)
LSDVDGGGSPPEGRDASSEGATLDGVEERRVVAFSPGDRVVAEAESTERTARYGVIEEVVHADPHPRYRIRWDDGHESIYTPADGALKLARTTNHST